VPPSQDGEAAFTNQSKLFTARHGQARRGRARQGQAGRGAARRGWARRGRAGHGWAGQGAARQGKAWFRLHHRRVRARAGKDRPLAQPTKKERKSTDGQSRATSRFRSDSVRRSRKAGKQTSPAFCISSSTWRVVRRNSKGCCASGKRLWLRQLRRRFRLRANSSEFAL
jgi:hypothetical protein